LARELAYLENSNSVLRKGPFYISEIPLCIIYTFDYVTMHHILDKKAGIEESNQQFSHATIKRVTIESLFFLYFSCRVK